MSPPLPPDPQPRAHAPARWLAPGLAIAGVGCPVILGGPDLSYVDAAPASGGDTVESDADADADADADSDTDTDTDPTTAVDPDAPVLDDVIARSFIDQVGFTFAITDPNDDLLGGTLHLDDGEAVIDLDIPLGLERWDPMALSTGTAPASIGCEVDYDVTWWISVTDLGGHTSAAVEVPVHVTALGTLPEQPAANEIGVVDPPVAVCVSYDGPYEAERLRFAVPVAGDYMMQLGWLDAPLNLGLWLYTGDSLFLGYSDVIGTEFEKVVQPLDAQIPYLVDPALYTATGSAPYEGVLLVRAE